MAKILVGRDNPKEVNVGITMQVAAQSEAADVQEEEQVQIPVENVDVSVDEEQQVAAAETSVVPEKAKTAFKGRGKKGKKA